MTSFAGCRTALQVFALRFGAILAAGGARGGAERRRALVFAGNPKIDSSHLANIAGPIG
jgi:hypothetical protein